MPARRGRVADGTGAVPPAAASAAPDRAASASSGAPDAAAPARFAAPEAVAGGGYDRVRRLLVAERCVLLDGGIATQLAGVVDDQSSTRGCGAPAR